MDKELPQSVRDKIVEKVVEREQARREKNWPTADRLRDELWEEGVSVEDTPEGPVLSSR